MIDDHPDQNQGLPNGKLVLPAYHEEMQQPPSANAPTTYVRVGKPVRPEQLIRRSAPSTPPGSPFEKASYLLRKDPAYQVLAIAVVVVLIASAVFASLIGKLFAPGSTRSGNVTTQIAAATANPVATTGVQATPASNPIPTPTAIVVAQPTIPVPTQQPTGPVKLQITSIPQRVSNGTMVPVAVTANQPGVSVHLAVTYDNKAFPRNYSSPAQITDGDGNAILSWQVQVFAFNNVGSFTAHVTAIAQGPDGQVKSQTVTVQVISNRAGG